MRVVGLFIDRVRFEGEPPSDAEIRAALREQVGSVYGLDAIERHGSELVITSMLEPVTRVYLLKLLIDRGGTPLDFSTRQPRPVALPAYVERPWREHSWWTRTKIQLGFHAGLLSTALPPPRRR